MRNFWGLMRAYWFSDSWKEAWALTRGLAVLTARASKARVWLAVLPAEPVHLLAYVPGPVDPNPLRALLTHPAFLAALVEVKDARLTAGRTFVSATLRRKCPG